MWKLVNSKDVAVFPKFAYDISIDVAIESEVDFIQLKYLLLNSLQVQLSKLANSKDVAVFLEFAYEILVGVNIESKVNFLHLEYPLNPLQQVQLCKL